MKVKALAERGASGEKENAKRILAKMEKDYPGLAKEAAKQAAPPSPAQEEPEKADGDERTGFGNWEYIFNFARSAVSNAYDFASSVANAYVGRSLAEGNVTLQVKVTKAGYVSMNIRMLLSVLQYAQSLNLVQRQAFRQVIHEMLDEQLDYMLGEDSSDREDVK